VLGPGLVVPGASLASRASRPAIPEDRHPAPPASLEGLLLVLPGPRGLQVLLGRRAHRELLPELLPRRP
jgi:hypothetical protein